MGIDYAKYKPESCASCTLLNAPGPVFGKSGYNEKLIYIGQNPGPREGELMQPFVGPSGNTLNYQLGECGIERGELFVTNQVKCVTPNNREPTSQEIECCRPLLAAELDKHKADVVILAGAVAFKANIGSYSTLGAHYRPSSEIFMRMGCVEQRHERKWIGTIHPAFIMRMPQFRHEALLHLKKAYCLSGVQVPLPEVVAFDKHGEDAALAALAEHKEMALERRAFADDVETDFTGAGSDLDEEDYTGRPDWILTMCGFSAIPYKAVIVPPKDIANWGDVFTNDNIWQFEQNGEYDRYYLEQYAPQRNARFDTMLAHHWLWNIARKALKPYVLRYYTNLPYYNRDLDKVDPTLYCGMDNITTYLAGLSQYAQMKKQGMLSNFLHFGMPILPILEQWRRIGLRVDIQRAYLYKRIIETRLAKAENLVEQMLGPTFNWKSSQQKAALFYKVWGLPPQYKKVKDKKTGTERTSITTDDGARTTLRRWINANPARQKQYSAAKTFFDLLDFTSENKKLLEYFDRIDPDFRGGAHWTAHAATFRKTSAPNLQNWPTWPIAKELGSLRSIGLPDHDDDLFLIIDYSQCQLWIYAVIFNIQYLLDMQKRGDYLYGAVYEDLFKRSFFKEGAPRTKPFKGEWVTDQELLRAKAVPLGFLFARSGESLDAEHGWVRGTGATYRKNWFDKVPELGRAHDQIMYDMKQKRELRPPPGMLLHYPIPDLQGLNCFAQTPEAMLIDEGIIKIEEAFKREGNVGDRTVLSVHDSIVTNVRGAVNNPSRMIHVAEDIIFPIVGRAVPWLKNFSFPFEAKVGPRWDWECSLYDKWKAKTTANV